jgi:NitT/TauT family transport system ATP-binding protein
MIGLLEVLQDYKGKMDLAQVSDGLRLELDDILPAVDAAKLLHLLQVQSGDLILTEEGKALLANNVSARKKALNKIISNLGEFKGIMDFIKKEHGGQMSKSDLIAFLKKKMPDVDPEETFSWIVEWGRYTLLFRYDTNNEKITIAKSSSKESTA